MSAFFILLFVFNFYNQEIKKNDDRITNEVCIFIDVDHPVSEKELMAKIQTAFQRAPVPVLIRFEGSVKLDIKNYMEPTDEDMAKVLSLLCNHHGARMVITNLDVGKAVRLGKIPWKVGGVTHYSDHFSIIFKKNRVFEDVILHEWGHQILGLAYNNPENGEHSLDPRSLMFGGSGRKWSSVKQHIWTAEDIVLIKEKIRILDAR